MKYLSIGIVAVCLFVSSQVHAKVDCPAMRYSVKLAEATGELRAEAESKMLNSLASQLRTARGGDTSSSTKAKIGGSYAVAAAGGLAQTAYSETLTTYFCEMRNAFEGQPSKIRKLEAEERAIKGFLLRLFDIGRWQVEAIDVRDEVTLDIEEAADVPPSFTVVEITKAIPSYKFDTVQIFEIFGGFTAANVGVEGCGGLVLRSVRKINPSVLADLDYMPVILTQWLASDQKNAKLELWTRVSAQMSQQLARTFNEEELRINDSMISCVEKAAQEAQKSAAELAQENAPEQLTQPEEVTESETTES